MRRCAGAWRKTFLRSSAITTITFFLLSPVFLRIARCRCPRPSLLACDTPTQRRSPHLRLHPTVPLVTGYQEDRKAINDLSRCPNRTDSAENCELGPASV